MDHEEKAVDAWNSRAADAEMTDALNRAVGKWAHADAENRELRELIADMWQFTGAACKKYPRLFDQPAQGGQMVQPNAIDAFEQRMRKLGIEVSDE